MHMSCFVFAQVTMTLTHDDDLDILKILLLRSRFSKFRARTHRYALLLM